MASSTPSAIAFDSSLISQGTHNDMTSLEYLAQSDGFSTTRFVWDLQDIRTIRTVATPQCDGALEDCILAHEWLRTMGCLQTTEADGVCEDAMSSWSQIYRTLRDGSTTTGPVSEHTPVPRTPLQYSSIRHIHDIAEAWGKMLHSVYTVLVLQYQTIEMRG
ncbi:hypothetical protein ARMGADRAFT_1077813 [Armillaria gallica]|uniref:Uncharacterized protein n=1 Tax=Armillaria gallica TaxID=47427 RepID=A0A2H3E3B2_ARMGA|nr:hypothetical protein ARMGADRAFT_1077813 [Armillaria gallica]